MIRLVRHLARVAGRPARVFPLLTLLLAGEVNGAAAGTDDAPQALARHRATTERFRTAYADASATKAVPAFIPLPPGEVRPEGWLRDWAENAAQGITGHLDERHPVFADGWKGVDITARGAKPGGAGWPIEQSAYWLDGLVRLGFILGDEALIAKARARLDPIVEGTLKSGHSLLHWRPRAEVEDPFNNWAHHHLARALVAYYEATAEPRILQALVTAYRDFPLPALPGDGSMNLDPLLETYALSGETALLERALAATRADSFGETVDAWNAGRLEANHGVWSYEKARVPALAWPWTGDPRHLDATLSALDWMEHRHGLPMGLDSSEEFHAGIGATRNVETCNVATAMWDDVWLLRLAGRREFADRIERVFLNAGPAPVARDFQTMSYYQCANRLSLALPEQEPRNPSSGGSYRFSELGTGVLCCVGNVNRVIPIYLQHMWLATPDGGLAAALYGPCRVRSFVAGDLPVEIECRTAYPFEETIAFTVRPARTAAFPLSLRVPAWCAAPAVEVNGRPVPAAPDPHGFVRLDRTWSAGDTVRLTLPMTATVQTGRETSYPKVDYFALKPNARRKARALAQVENIASPFATVSYGPLLFSLPIPDTDPNTPTPGAAWNYALDVAPARAAAAITVVRTAMPAKWSWQFDSPLKLTVAARRFDWQPTELQPLPSAPVTDGETARITLVPYGCTKFRVTMFPVTPKVLP